MAEAKIVIEDNYKSSSTQEKEDIIKKKVINIFAAEYRKKSLSQ